MIKIAQRGAAEMERFAIPRGLCWDDVRLFLACANAESFRKAARSLNLSSSTVVRRIEKFERMLGVPLFERVPEGVVLTRDGRQLVGNARQMEQACFDLLRHRTIDVVEKGSVTISITEGLGTYWVMPRLVDFQRQHPFVMLNLQCAMQNADVLRLEADMAVQFSVPENPDLRVVKLGRLHVQLFASRRYLELYGAPASVADLPNHRMIQQVAPGLDEGALARFVGLQSVEDTVAIKTNASTAHFYAIEKGAGIGALPTFAVALGAPVVPVDLGTPYFVDIWLTYHRDARRTPRRALVIDWLKRIFDPKIHPWFRDEFIHPNELAQRVPPEARENVNQGYFSVLPR